MSPGDILALLLRHRIAVTFAVLVAGVLSFRIIHANPGYMESGGVVFTAPKSASNIFQSLPSLQVTEETVAGYMMGSQGGQQVRAAGGTAPYTVAMLNTYNEDFPDYSQPYVTITAMSNNPETARQTFGAVLGVLGKATRALQVKVGATPDNAVRATLIAAPTGPIEQGGSRKRSAAGLGVLAIIAVYLVARVLDRRRRHTRPVAAYRRQSGSGRHAAATLRHGWISLR